MILVSQPGIKPTPTAVEAQSLSHQTTREAPILGLSNAANCSSPAVSKGSTKGPRVSLPPSTLSPAFHVNVTFGEKVTAFLNLLS